MNTETVGTDRNGRTPDGKFGSGNQFAKGHKHRQHIARLRRAFTSALTESDVLNIVAKLIELGQAGDVTAIRLILDRALGRVQPAEDFAEGENELDAEEELQSVIRQVKGIQPDCPPDMLVQKAQLFLRFQELSETQKASLLAKMRERKALQAASNSSPPETP